MEDVRRHLSSFVVICRPHNKRDSVFVHRDPSVSDTYTGDPSVSDTYTGDPSVSDTYTGDPSVSDTYTGDPSVSDTYTGDPSVSDTFICCQQLEMKKVAYSAIVPFSLFINLHAAKNL